MATKGSGVEVRPHSIRINFTYAGEKQRPTLTVNGVPLLPTVPNRKYAERIALQVKAALAAGSFQWDEFFPDSKQAKLAAAQPSQPTRFGPLADMWLTSKGQLEEASLDQYRNAIEIWKGIIGADTELKDITFQFLATKIGSQKWTSAKAANNYLIPLRGIMGFEYAGPRAGLNPMIGIKNMPTEKKLPDPLSMAERDQIIAFMFRHFDERVTAYFVFAFFTGMRPEELIALRWSDIDWSHHSIRIQRKRTFKGTNSNRTKTKYERDVDLCDEALAALSVMEKYTRGKTTDEGIEADIFQNPNTLKGWHDERSQRDHYWKPALVKLGIRLRRAYVTRHTYATCGLMGGVRIGYIADQLGHSVVMLEKKYAKWLRKADGNRERAVMQRAMRAITFPPEVPQEPISDSKSLIHNQVLGRRDWTRTNKRG